MGWRPHLTMRASSKPNSLAGQVIATNVLMVVAVIFAASAATHLNLTVDDQRIQFGLLGLSMLLFLLVNMLMLRRRFSPLEELIEHIEAIDPADPGRLEAPGPNTSAEEVDRLAASFRQLLARIDDERRRSGRLVLRA